MPDSDLNNVTSTGPLSAFTTWLKRGWAVYISDLENHVTVLRAETIEPAHGSPYMRWAVAKRR
jgi:hypothetical protein